MIEFPIVRDMDTNMYERQDGSGLEIGSYAHRADPPRPRGHPVERGGGALADRVPVHAGGLREADGGRARADPRGAERRVGRHQVRDQRPPLADARRAAAPRRDARGEGPLVGGRGLGQGGSGRRQVGCRVDDARRVGDRPAGVRHRALLRAPALGAHQGARSRGLQQDLRDRPPVGAVGVEPQRAAARRSTRASRSSAPCSSRRPAGSGRSGTSRTRSCWTSTATASTVERRSGSRAGGRRSSTPSTSRCATARRCSTCPPSASSTSPARARSTSCSSLDASDGRCRSGRSSTRRCSRRAATFKSDLT